MYVDKASCLIALSVIWSSSEADRSWYWPNMSSAVDGIHLCHSPLINQKMYVMSIVCNCIVAGRIVQRRLEAKKFFVYKEELQWLI